jgi:ribonuclease Z
MLSADADVLVHEATFDSTMDALAQTYYHSTAKEAAQTAKRAGAKQLILTHISSRYQEDEAQRLLSEAKEQFSATWIARDHWSFPIT